MAAKRSVRDHLESFEDAKLANVGSAKHRARTCSWWLGARQQYAEVQELQPTLYQQRREEGPVDEGAAGRDQQAHGRAEGDAGVVGEGKHYFNIIIKCLCSLRAGGQGEGSSPYERSLEQGMHQTAAGTGRGEAAGGWPCWL